MSVSQAVRSFSAGELSPLVHSRVDSESYYKGCRTLENMIPLAYGAAQRRPGTEYLGEAVIPSQPTRLIPFVFSEGTAYQVELCSAHLYIWDMSGKRVTYDPQNEWLTATDYAVNDFVKHEGLIYVCVVAHTSNVFATDYASAHYWNERDGQYFNTPYEDADLREVQTLQINDVVFFTHPSFPPHKLTRYLNTFGDVVFLFEEITWDWPPMLEQNATAATLDADATTGTGVILSSSETGFFKESHIGAYFQIAHRRASASVQKNFTADGSSSTIKIFGTWSLNTYGTWAATLAIERSFDNGGTWETIRSYVRNSDANVSDGGVEIRECTLRITITNRTVGTSGDYAILDAADSLSYGLVQVTDVNVAGPSTIGKVTKINVISGGSGYYITPPIVTISGGGGSGATATATISGGRVTGITITNAGGNYVTAPTVTITSGVLGGSGATAVAIIGIAGASTATVDVINDLESTDPTTYWAEGAWSDLRGYPRSVAAHEGRIYYGGTIHKPQSVWATAIDDYYNFRTGPLADDGLFFTAASNRTSVIQWMVSKDGYLFIGRAGSEGNLSSGSAEAAISPGAVRWNDTTAFGSRHIQPALLGDSLFFVDRNGRKVRSFGFDNNSQSFGAPDMAFLSEHITKGGIVEVSAQQAIDPILWMIRADGVLLGMTYDQGVSSWHRHTTDGEFESVSCVPGEFGDEVWFVVRRTIDGVSKRLIERFRPAWREAWEDEDKPSWWYLDCAKRFDEVGGVTIAGLDHLEGEAVAVLADGAEVPGTFTVDGSGEITIPLECETAIVGLPYVSTIAPMVMHMDLRNGTSRGRKARIDRIVADVYKTLGGEFSTDGGQEWTEIEYRGEDDDMDDSPPPFTGETQSFADGGFNEGGADITLRQTSPMPLCVRSIIAKWLPSGD